MVNVKLRPIKLAFLVDPKDSKGLARAIELNSTLWGGSYNPIIPTFRKVPKIWKESHIFGYNSEKILRGYIEAFNPDFIVPIGKCKKINLKGFSQEIVDDKDLDTDLKQGAPGYGIGIFEVLKGFFNKELKFKRKYPIEVIHPILPQKNKLFFQSVFGYPPKPIREVLEKHWKEPLDVKDVKINLENYTTHIRSFFLRKILNFKTEALNNAGWSRGETIFLMDASNNHDIMDYWNLRAMGWDVLPVPIQAKNSDSAKKSAQQFIEGTSGVSRHNKDIYYHTTLMKARSIDDKLVREFAESLKVKQDKNANVGPRFAISNSYPRMWDEWARHKDGVGYCELESKTKSYDFNDVDEVRIDTLDPEFAFRFGNHKGETRFVNDVETSNYSYDDLYADVIPEGGDNINRALSAISLNEWRFSRRTASYLSNHTKWHINIKIPKAEDVFIAWMKDKGVDINLSAPGRIAKQMIKHLGGLHGLNVLSNENMISLLKNMESGKEMTKELFWAEISKISSTRKFAQDAQEVLKSYIERKIFKLGVTLQCPTCTHRSWYDIKSLDYSVVCANCLEEFNIPTHSPNDIKWSYKTIGPFSLPKRAEGVYPTLLTLRLFSSVFHSSLITPMLSFETTILGKPMEVDLGLFFRESRHSHEDETRTIFAECKAENNFEKSDIEKMKLLAKKFPGAVLIFATLKEELSKKEIKLLKPLVNKCRRYYKSEEPYNPVLILTKTELLANWDIHHAWEEKGGKYTSFGKNKPYSNQLLSICDATQQIYLGMKPWHEFINEQFEKRRKRKLANVQKNLP